jgi:hypothetical protein
MAEEKDKLEVNIIVGWTNEVLTAEGISNSVC